MKRILITGVSSGIGNALARAYLSCGAEVYGISRRTPTDLTQTPRFSFKSLDLLKTETIEATVCDWLAGVESLDLVILNAGTLGKVGDLSEMKIADFQEAMLANVWANKQLLDAVLSTCNATEQVVAISSVAGVSAFRGTPGYCLSKAGLNMLMALYAEERSDTHFSAVAPCPIYTPMQIGAISSPENLRFPALSSLQAMYKSGGMLQPEDGAQLLMELFHHARQKPSGAFIEASEKRHPLRRCFAGPSKAEKVNSIDNRCAETPPISRRGREIRSIS